MLAFILAAAVSAAPMSQVELWVRAEPDGFSSVRCEALGVDLTARARSPGLWSFSGKAGAPAAFEARREHASESGDVIPRWRFAGLGSEWTLEQASRLRADYRLKPADGGPSLLFAAETSGDGPDFRIEGTGVELRTRSSGRRTAASGTAAALGPGRAALIGASLVLLRLSPPRRAEAGGAGGGRRS